MNTGNFIETKNMRGMDGEIVFSDGTTEIIEYDRDDPIMKFQTYGGNKNIVSVKFPGSIKTIEFAAFSECTSLKSITLPKGLESLEDSAFLSCASIADITVPEGNKHYKSVDGVLFTADGKRLICYPPKKAGAEYTVPDGVTDIASSAFYGCKSLVSINIPESVAYIGGSAFEGCAKLENIAVPKGVTVIGGGAFKDCVSLESMTFPWGVDIIGCSVFENCTALKSVTVTRNVTAVKDRAFFGCKRLESIITAQDDGSEKVAFRVDERKNGILKDNKYSEGFLISTTSIGWNAFEGCESLKTIAIPYGAYSIGRYAFKGCKNLESVIIPKSVNYIGKDIFEGCGSLKSIYYEGSVLGWKRIEKRTPYPELIRLGEDKYESAMIYYHHSESKFYGIIKLSGNLWKDFLDNGKNSLLHKILIAIIIVSLLGAVLSFLIPLIF